MVEVLHDDFYGEMTYKADSKMRVINPLFNDGETEQPLYLLICAKQKEHDRCVLCMNVEQFKEYYGKLTRVPHNTPAYEIVKHVLSGVAKIKTDKQGKILIPKYLRDYAGVEDTVTYRVTDEALEIWSPSRLAKKKAADLANAAAYTDLERYMDGANGDYADVAACKAEKQGLENQIEILELRKRRNELLGITEDES